MSDRKHWEPELIERLHALYGLYSHPELARRLSKHAGRRITPRAVAAKAFREGLKAKDAQGYLTVADLARELGIDRKRLSFHINRRLPASATIGRGQVRYVTEEAEKAIRAYYAAPGEPVVQIGEAADRLGYQGKTLWDWVKAGRIRAVKIGGWTYIPEAEIARILRERRRAC